MGIPYNWLDPYVVGVRREGRLLPLVPLSLSRSSRKGEEERKPL